MSKPHNSEPGSDVVSNAVHQLAMSFHEEFVRDLDPATRNGGPTLEERLELHQRTYPTLLFGELAMHLAQVELPENATAPDRARGIMEALRQIATTPRLFEAVTNAPFSTEFAAAIIPQAVQKEKTTHDKKFDAEATTLQQKVTAAGYLEWSMCIANKIVQLEYVGSDAIKTGRFSKNKLPPDVPVSLKVLPVRGHGWNIKQYNHWNSNAGYYDYMDTRRFNADGTFALVAVDSEAKVPPDLSKLVGKVIRLGQISTGSQLKLEHTLRHDTKEVPGHETDITSSTLSLGAQLRQAYYGDSKDYPLFSGR